MRKRHVPPSRIRYEAKKPTLSFRVTKEELQEIREIKRKSGLKLSTLMLQGARISEELKESYARGYQRGYRNAFGRFLIRCGGCGDPIEVDLQWPSVKGISLKFFGERIQHYGCLPKRAESGQRTPTRAGRLVLLRPRWPAHVHLNAVSERPNSKSTKAPVNAKASS